MTLGRLMLLSLLMRFWSKTAMNNEKRKMKNENQKLPAGTRSALNFSFFIFHFSFVTQ
jgi:hypothetical protein